MTDRENKFYTMWFFIKKYHAWCLGIFFVTFFYVIFESFNIGIFFPLLKLALEKEMPSGQIFLFIKKITSFFPVKDFFVSTCILAVIILFVKEAIAFARQVLVGYGVGKISYDVKKKIFDKYIGSDYDFFTKNKQGSLTYVLLYATGKLGTCFNLVPELLVTVLMILAIGALLFSISLHFTLFLIIIGVIFNYVTHTIAKKISYDIGVERIQVSEEAQITANELFDGIKQIKTFNAGNHWRNNFKRMIKRFKELMIRDAVWMSILERLMYLTPVLLFILFLLFAKYTNKDFTSFFIKNLPKISVYVVAFMRLVPYMTSFGKTRLRFMGLLPNVDIVHDAITREAGNFKDGGREIVGFNKEIRFRNVRFKFGNGRNILDGVDFTVKKGETTAIAGPSGAGKTTLINLFLRLLKPGQGEITIDGVNIEEFKYSSLTKLISTVDQQVFIFNGSIIDNIRFGKEDVSVGAVIEASKLAHAHEFISSFPEGYETIVGDKGMKLSGGQKQRLLIARSLLRDPEILILDEATSSLDYRSEAFIQDSLSQISKTKTLIIIAHRLSTIMNADNIIVLDKGRIAEEGSHAELLEKRGIYYSLYRSQEKLDPLTEETQVKT